MIAVLNVTLETQHTTDVELSNTTYLFIFNNVTNQLEEMSTKQKINPYPTNSKIIQQKKYQLKTMVVLLFRVT